MNLYKLFFIFLFISSTFVALGQNTDSLILLKDFKQTDISDKISVFTADSSKTAENIIIEYNSLNNQKQKQSTTTIGFSSDNYWAVFHLINQSGKKQEIDIVVNNPHIDFLELYELKDSIKIIKKYASGDRSFFNTRPVNNRLFLFPVAINVNEAKTFLLKIDKRNAAVSFPISIWEHNARYDYDYKFNLIYGAYFGVVFLIFVYAIIGFFYLKRSTFLYYSFYVLFIALYFFTALGYSFQYLYPNSSDANNHARVILIILILGFLIRFSQKILLTQQYVPVLHRILNAIVVFAVLMLIKWVFFSQLYTPFTIVFLKAFYLLAFISFIILVIVLIKVYKRHKKIVLFYIAAFSAFFAGSILVVFIEFGLIKESLFVINPMFIGSAVELVIFAFALSYQIKQVFENNTELSIKVADTQKQNMRSYMQGIAKERIRIAKELHDSVGSKINLLKNSLEQKDFDSHILSNQISDIGHLVRDISHKIYLPELKILGLKSKLENLKNSFIKANNMDLEIDYYDFPDKLPTDIEKEIFHIIEEALNNVIKYAAANEVIIQLFGHETELNITIEDNGKGFDMNKKDHANGIGLKIMKSRAESLGGSFEISSAPAMGTAIVVVIPFNQ